MQCAFSCHCSHARSEPDRPHVAIEQRQQLRGGPRFLTRRDPGQLQPSRQRARGSHRRTSPSLCGFGGNLGPTTVRDRVPGQTRAEPAPRALQWGTAFATATRPRKRFRPKRQQEDRLPATQSGLGWQRAHGSHYIAIPSPRGTACINATRPRAQGAAAQRQDHTPSVPAITIATPGAGKADTPPACRQALTTTPGAGKLGKFTLQGLQGTAHKRDATLQHEHSLSQYQGNAKKS
ncbi:hypothetical protein NDU88_004814 [Pleurodeles waltl]|uniref:Uncharacterized protein n=1 Tax=Pleurodeles waltl TaxID=8319 RepID=A0AAV7L0H7_PLEWA|nr:hypothetical protein NDU88_004814 [Pleurodeles waltl]